MYCLFNSAAIPHGHQIQILSPYYSTLRLTGNMELMETPPINPVFYYQAFDFAQFQNLDFALAQGGLMEITNVSINQNSSQENGNQQQKKSTRKSAADSLMVSGETESEPVANMEQIEEGQKIVEKNHSGRNKSETKNLIKNYGRAILTFILKSRETRLKVLDHLHIDDKQFVECVYMFRKSIHTISAIRYLWQQHPFRQAFRMLSCEYLRKHNLSHIFNSRITKHGIYLKYQTKLMKSLQKPHEFQSIKQI